MSGKRIGYSYTRFSTATQKGGDSQRRQDDMADSYARRMGITLDHTLNLRDAGLSAFSSAHKLKGALGKFLAAVQSGRIARGSILIVEAIDRLSREDPLTAFETVTSLMRAGIELHTLEDGAIYTLESIDNGEFRRLADKIDSARHYSKRLSRRLSEAWTQKRMVSDKPLSKICPGWLRVENGEYKIIPERAAVIRRIYEETANGIGREVVSKRLNEDGIPPFNRAGQGITDKGEKATLWHSSYIQKILVSRAALGYYQPHEKRTANDKKRVPVGLPRLLYPPVIDAELYQRAMAARAARIGRGGPKGRHYYNILNGFCECGICEGRMTYSHKGPRRPHLQDINYLMCDKAVRGGDCSNKSYFQYEKVEKALLDTIMNWHTYDKSLFVVARTQEHEILSEIARLNQDKEGRQIHIDNLLEDFKGQQPKSVKNKIIELENIIEEIEAKLSTLKTALDKLQSDSAASHFDQIHKVRERAETGDYEARATLHQALLGIVEFIVFDPSDLSAFVALKGMVMTFLITKAGNVEQVGFHNNGKSMFPGFTGLIDTPEIIANMQREKPSKAIIQNMKGITFEQAKEAIGMH